jgi:hypothetical protein
MGSFGLRPCAKGAHDPSLLMNGFNEEFHDYVIKKYSFMTIERIWRNPKGSGGAAPRIKLLVMFSIFVIKNYSFMTQLWTPISILGGAEGRGS